MKRLQLITLAVLVALLATPAEAQETRAATAPKGLALEVEDGQEQDFQVHVKGGLETGRWRWLPGWERQAGTPRLSAVKLDTDYEGEAVRINVSVVFDDTHPADAPGPKYGRKVQAVASYLAREGEAVRLEELARYGIEPMTFRVVKAKPRREEPELTATPVAANDLKAVEVVGFEPDRRSPDSRNTYKIKLRNASQKNITALSLYDDSSGGRGTTLLLGSAARPLMAPGATHETLFRFSVGGRATPRGYEHNGGVGRTLKVGTVVFDDDTYEGDAATAVSIFARRRGDDIQRARILPLLRGLLDAAPPPDVAAALEKLKSEVESLRIDADPTAVAELVAQFPRPARGGDERRAELDPSTRLSMEMMAGLQWSREVVLDAIRQWEQARARGDVGFDLRARLSALAERIERGGRR